MTRNLRAKGQIGERKALEYLFSKNYSYVDSNWQKREGEIDLIVFDNQLNELVFVEVKFRNSEKFGTIEESITSKKKIKLNDIIDRYISEMDYHGKYRLDFIGIVGNLRLIHYKNIVI